MTKSDFEKTIDTYIEDIESEVDTFKELCINLEHFETPEWAANAILQKEILTNLVIDPCAGMGVLVEAVQRNGYECYGFDVHDWGWKDLCFNESYYAGICDFLNPSEDLKRYIKNNTVFMNPPFALAELFVKKAFELGARKVVCFQRFSWYEGSYDSGKKRGQFWEKYRPARIWVCGDRASCWRHDLRKDDKGNRYDETGKKLAGSSTSHAWFVWERGHVGAAITGHIFKGDAK